MLELLLSRETDILVWVSYILSVAVVVFLSTPIHEFAHAFTAVKLGDPTPKYTGRTTLNPLAHIDNIGALLILIFGFGWAKPVRVNPRNFNRPKLDMALTALAGPVSNVVVAFVFFVILKFLGYVPAEGFLKYLSLFVLYVFQINLSLAVFNLIPLPPLDGSRILAAVLPDNIYYRLMQYERYFYFALILLLALDVLEIPLNFLYNSIYMFFELITFWI